MGARAFSEAERINALGDCLADALDHAGLYEVGTDADFALLVDVLTVMISGFRCFCWNTDPQNLSMTVEVPELWIAGAIERALLGRGPDEESIWVSRTTVQ